MTTRLRGLVHEEVTVTGPSIDLHSGMYGGPAINPIKVLAGSSPISPTPRSRVTLPGFYDEVRDLSPEIRRQWAALSFDERVPGKGRAEAVGGRGGLHRPRADLGRPPPRSTASSAAIPGPAPRPSSPRRPRPSFPSARRRSKSDRIRGKLPAFVHARLPRRIGVLRPDPRREPCPSTRATASSAPPARRSRTSGTKPQSCSARADRSRSSATCRKCSGWTA